MGISGLLPFLKKIHEQVNIARFKGCTVAIDAYCWLHKGAFSCAEKLALKEDTDQYVFYCMKYINYILSKDIKPIMVFDGCHLESKAGVEKTRRERRELHRKRAAQFLREGKRNEAKECLQKCVDITPQMALKLIQACRDRGVDCIVAPYEADAQLAFLSLSGIAQIIITEDSDLLLFGCDKIIFKMDFFGNGTLIEKNRLNEVLAVESGFYTFEKFRHMCILSGCDYLPSLPGIGLATANKVFKLARQGDIRLLIKKLPTYLKKNLTVTDDYVEGFIKADNTFLYQLVFDPLHRALKPLNPYPPEIEGEDLGYAGHQIPSQMAYQIALGNIDIHTHAVMADFDPDTFVPKNQIEAKYRHQLSIWSKNYAVKSGSPCKEIQPSCLIDTVENENSIVARGRIVPKSKIIKLSHQSDDHNHCTMKVSEVLDVYNNPNVTPKQLVKKRMFDDLDDSRDIKWKSKRKCSHDDLDSSDMSCNDENDRTLYKRSPMKLSKIKYDASNIGEEAFKEGSVSQPKNESMEGSHENHLSRNIFAVAKTKTSKSSVTVSSSAGTQSKYFSNTSSKANTTVISDCDEHSPVVAVPLNNSDNKEKSTLKKESFKPLSLKEMFKNLKDKKTEEEGTLKRDNFTSSKKTNNVDNPYSCKSKQQNSRTPSAFSWSKFQFNLSSRNSTSKFTKSDSTCSSPSSVSNNKRDSFSELLAGDTNSAISNSSSFLSKSSSPTPLFSSSPSLAKQNSESNAEKILSTRTHDDLLTMKQMSVTTPDSDVTEIKSQSYESFLISMKPLSGSAPKDTIEGLESESPFPEPNKNNSMTKIVDVNFVDCEENPVGSSQEKVIDLTLGDSQISNASQISRSSNSSGRSKCRVSGLSKRKGQGKKTDGPKSDSSQRSVKDLFSKFAFKKETGTKPTAISTSYSRDSLNDSSDDDLSETPIHNSIDISDADVVRRKLLL